MTEKKELEEALDTAESLQSTCIASAIATTNEAAKQMFKQMAEDMELRISSIENHLNSTDEEEEEEDIQ